MTREEAIKTLRELCRETNESWYEETYNMAIEALQNLSKPNNGLQGSDIISRQDAIDAIRKFQTYKLFEKDNMLLVDQAEVMTELMMLPSADRPTGNWVRLEREENVYDLHGVPTWGVNYMCDKCGFITTALQDHFEQYKFCPHCGKRLVIER